MGVLGILLPRYLGYEHLPVNTGSSCVLGGSRGSPCLWGLHTASHTPIPRTPPPSAEQGGQLGLASTRFIILGAPAFHYPNTTRLCNKRNAHQMGMFLHRDFCLQSPPFSLPTPSSSASPVHAYGLIIKSIENMQLIDISFKSSIITAIDFCKCLHKTVTT